MTKTWRKTLVTTCETCVTHSDKSHLHWSSVGGIKLLRCAYIDICISTDSLVIIVKCLQWSPIVLVVLPDDSVTLYGRLATPGSEILCPCLGVSHSEPWLFVQQTSMFY